MCQNSTRPLKKLNVSQIIHRVEKEGTLPNPFYEASIALTASKIKTTTKIICRLMPQMNVDPEFSIVYLHGLTPVLTSVAVMFTCIHT